LLVLQVTTVKELLECVALDTAPQSPLQLTIHHFIKFCLVCPQREGIQRRVVVQGLWVSSHCS